jgi:hypothetical protein
MHLSDQVEDDPNALASSHASMLRRGLWARPALQLRTKASSSGSFSGKTTWS